jgi:hypothetical protein
MWFGMQVVLSCATNRISYVTTGPLQNATHNLRFPLILCLVVLVAPLFIEVIRLNIGAFKKDRLRWQAEAKLDAPADLNSKWASNTTKEVPSNGQDF